MSTDRDPNPARLPGNPGPRGETDEYTPVDPLLEPLFSRRAGAASGGECALHGGGQRGRAGVGTARNERQGRRRRGFLSPAAAVLSSRTAYTAHCPLRPWIAPGAA